MFTQPSAPIRLLIAEHSENQAYQLDSLLRDAGIATRSEVVTDLAQINVLKNGDKQDLVIWRTNFGNVDNMLPELKEEQPEIPVILLADEDHPISSSQGMALGAADVVSSEDPDHLLYVVRREVTNLCQRDRLAQTRRALKEAEQRCQLLLSNADAAIAYVHEGMHIYANEAYQTLFGFDDADDLVGAPLMDLMDGDNAAKVKEQMKQFRGNGAETTFGFTGTTQTGQPIAGQMTFEAAEYEGEACIQVSVRTDQIEDIVRTPPSRPPAETNNTAASLDSFASAIEALTRQLGDRCCAIAVIGIDGFDKRQLEMGLSRSLDLSAGVADIIAEQLEDDGAFARIDSHRFAAAWLCDDVAANHLRAEQIRSKVEDALFDIDARTVRCTVSVGVTTLSSEVDAPMAVDSALSTLLSAPDDETNKVYWDSKASSGDDASGSDEARRILGLINTAIENQSFVLLFQPIISLRGDSDEHYEVFLRLPDESGEQILPRDFLSLAIEHGVAGKIDRWVILQSIKMLSVHRSKGHNTRLTINLTGKQHL